MIVHVIVWLISLILMTYGLYLFFKEKKHQKN